MATGYRVENRTRSEEDEFMLQLTHDAAAEIAEARRAQGVPETFGVRVYGEPQSGGGMEVGLTFAQVPAEDDEVTEQEGTRVFVAPELAGPLSAAAIDVEQTPEGTKLVLTPQETGGEA
jgi:Fe-S cluster assembly iron-binding protein IscA